MTKQNANESQGPITDLLAYGVGCSGIAQVLKTVRKYLGMDVAFVSRFRQQDRVFEYVDAEGVSPIAQGQSISLAEGYCLRVVEGLLPQVIPDTSVLPEAMAIPETKQIPIGSHLSVPIQLDNGETYGTLCCFSYEPDETLGERDLKLLRALAEVLASRFAELQEVAKVRAEKVAVLRRVIQAGAPRIVFQPLCELQSRRMTSVECLARFDQEPKRSPDQWFNEANEVGMGEELELLTIRKALAALDDFPKDISLSVNTSPRLVISRKLDTVLESFDLSRIILEITEHAAVADNEALGSVLQPLREKGLTLAIDDAGAGYASMRHIVNLLPEQIKLDMSLTRDIDSDASRRSLAKALIAFAHDIGSVITAEGVETEAELTMLESLGGDKVQGYYLSKPLPLNEVLHFNGAQHRSS